MGKHGYWLCGRPTSGNAKGWQDMDHANIITDSMSPDQWAKLIEKYNARVDAFNKELREDVQLTHPTVSGAAVGLGYHGVSICTERWIVDIKLAPRFQYWPGLYIATIKRENVKRLDLHWANGAEAEFYKWLNDPIVLEARK